MQPEERYRAALIALRDRRWEEAAQHLLIIAADDPTYREIDQVLETLQRTHGPHFWCAAFDVARSYGRLDVARAAMHNLAALDSEHPALSEMRLALATDTPASPSASPHSGVSGNANTAATPTNVPPFIMEEPVANVLDVDALPYTPDADGDPFAALDLDPLTQLVLSDDWQTKEIPAIEEPPGTADRRASPSVEAIATAWPESLDDTHGSTVQDTQPMLLPTEPEGDFIRLEPAAFQAETEETPMQLDLPESVSGIEVIQPAAPATRRYSFLQAIGLLSFVAILAVVAAYVLFGQGGETLLDLLVRAREGAAIEDVDDLIAAVDAALSQPESPSNTLAALTELGELVAPIAEETPLVGRAIEQWIAAAGQLMSATANQDSACSNETSPECSAARHAIAVLTQQVARRRALVCTWTPCPTTPVSSGEG